MTAAAGKGVGEGGRRGCGGGGGEESDVDNINSSAGNIITMGLTQ